MTDYPYRQGVNGIIIDNENNFLLVQKTSYDFNQWEFPGGGLEDGENPEKGLLRELKEELGSDNFEIIKESPIVLRFEWPEEAQERGFAYHGKWWRGQEKRRYILRFNGNKDEFKLQEDEIRYAKWVPYTELDKHLVFEGQWEDAKKVLEEAGLSEKLTQ